VAKMMKLIKLELRRNNIKPYLWGSLGIFIFAVAMGVFINATPLIVQTTHLPR